MHKAKRVNRRCEVCNTLMFDVHYKQRFCPACSAARKRQRNRIIYATQRAAATPPKRSHRTPADRRRGLTIAQINSMAADEGLSYGQYVSKNRLY